MMIIEHKYAMSSSADLTFLSELYDWCANNLGPLGLEMMQEGVAYNCKTYITLRFSNRQDLNYCNLIFGDKLNPFLITESCQFY